MDLNRRTDPLLIGFITLSLLLHLLLLYLVPRRSLLPPAHLKEPPVVVEMRPPQPRERELEMPKTPDQERTRPAKRLGPSDRQVVREKAPKGQDFEDRTPHRPAPAQKPRQQAQKPPAPTTKPEPRPQAQAKLQKPQPQVVPEATAPLPRAETAPPQKLPPLKDLLTLPQTTTDRMVAELRRKYRPEVEEGDAVWLDTEKDLLFSFFRRFKDGIYRVWNYPQRAAERGQEGVCLLKITINRDGSVAGVKLVESSGSPILDNEALAAVRRGGPYGKLPEAYKERELNIFAFFRYSLLHSARDIFGGN